MTRITSLYLVHVSLLLVSNSHSPPNRGFISLCSLLQLHMKSRTRSNNQVITLRQSIKSALKYAPSVALYDPACDPRHLAVLFAHA